MSMYPLPLPEMETESALQTSKPSIQSVYPPSMQPLSIHPWLVKSAFLVKINLCGEAQKSFGAAMVLVWFILRGNWKQDCTG